MSQQVRHIHSVPWKVRRHIPQTAPIPPTPILLRRPFVREWNVKESFFKVYFSLWWWVPWNVRSCISYFSSTVYVHQPFYIWICISTLPINLHYSICNVRLNIRGWTNTSWYPYWLPDPHSIHVLKCCFVMFDLIVTGQIESGSLVALMGSRFVLNTCQFSDKRFL